MLSRTRISKAVEADKVIELPPFTIDGLLLPGEYLLDSLSALRAAVRHSRQVWA